MAYPDVILAESGLVSYWRLGEASGTFADSKDSNPSIAVGAGVTYGQTGLQTSDANLAASFSGTTSYIRVADAANMDITGTLSVEAFIKPVVIDAAGGTYYGILTRYTTTQNGSYELYVVSSGGAGGGQLQCLIRGGGATSTFNGASNAITQGSIYHVVVTYEDATNEGKMYLNGVQSGSTDTNITAVLDATAADINIGGRYSSGGIGAADQLFFNGIIDEVALYNSVLTLTQVQAHYAAATSTPGSGSLAWLRAL